MGIQNKTWTRQYCEIQDKVMHKRIHQVPRVDYTESVANMSTILILLHMEDHGWICKMLNVEAAFLNA